MSLLSFKANYSLYSKSKVVIAFFPSIIYIQNYNYLFSLLYFEYELLINKIPI